MEWNISIMRRTLIWLPYLRQCFGDWWGGTRVVQCIPRPYGFVALMHTIQTVRHILYYAHTVVVPKLVQILKVLFKPHVLTNALSSTLWGGLPSFWHSFWCIEQITSAARPRRLEFLDNFFCSGTNSGRVRTLRQNFRRTVVCIAVRLLVLSLRSGGCVADHSRGSERYKFDSRPSWWKLVLGFSGTPRKSARLYQPSNARDLWLMLWLICHSVGATPTPFEARCQRAGENGLSLPVGVGCHWFRDCRVSVWRRWGFLSVFDRMRVTVKSLGWATSNEILLVGVI